MVKSQGAHTDVDDPAPVAEQENVLILLVIHDSKKRHDCSNDGDGDGLGAPARIRVRVTLRVRVSRCLRPHLYTFEWSSIETRMKNDEDSVAPKHRYLFKTWVSLSFDHRVRVRLNV